MREGQALRGRWAGHDPAGLPGGQQRARGQAELVDQTGGGELTDESRSTLGQDARITEVDERGDRRGDVDGIRTSLDYPGMRGQRGLPLGGRCGGRDDDGLRRSARYRQQLLTA